jgi:hypothetical protein
MDIKNLRGYSEWIAEKVHDSCLEEKKNQGFHAPVDCRNQSAKDICALALLVDLLEDFEFLKFNKYCDKCRIDMYPYSDLPEHIKDYDRAAVNAVLSIIELG